MIIVKPDPLNNSRQEICWFCKKGRHSECMKQIPINVKTDGPHDCSFNTDMVDCTCTH